MARARSRASLRRRGLPMTDRLQDVASVPRCGALHRTLATGAADWHRELETARRLAWFADASGAAGHHRATGQQASILGDAEFRYPHDHRTSASPQRAAPVFRPVGRASIVEPYSAWPRSGQGGSPAALARSAPGAAMAVASVHASCLVPTACRDPSPAGPLSLQVVTGSPAGELARTSAAVPPQRFPATSPPAAPVRVHIEETPEGLVLWLGIDAGAAVQAPRTAGLIAELRRLLAGSGQRLCAVICNGARVDDGAAHLPNLHQEP